MKSGGLELTPIAAVSSSVPSRSRTSRGRSQAVAMKGARLLRTVNGAIASAGSCGAHAPASLSPSNAARLDATLASADGDDASSSTKELNTEEYAYYDSLPAPGKSAKRLRAH